MNAPLRVAGLQAPHLISPDVLALRPRALWHALRSQPYSVWAVLLYVFFEYVRPQTIYPWFDVLPWARLSLIASLAFALSEAQKVRRWTLIDVGIAVYTLVVFASLIAPFSRAFGLKYLDIYLSWVAIYYVISTAINTQTRVLLMLLSWSLWNLKMSVHAFRSWVSSGFAFRDWGVSGAPGWFQNSGEFGIQMCIVLPISLYVAIGLRSSVSKRTFLLLLVLPFTAVTGAVASSSRGALLGIASVGLWMLFRSRYKVRGFFALATFLAVFYALVPNEQRERISAAGNDDTSTSRLTYWRRGLEIAHDYPVLGIGYKNWLPFYSWRWGSSLSEGERVELPHNIFIECMSELGYVGLATLLFLLFSTFWLNARTRELARRLRDDGYLLQQVAWGLDGGVIGFVVSGFFVTVLYYPYLWVNLAMTVATHLSVSRAVKAMRASQSPLARNRLRLQSPDEGTVGALG